MDKCIKIFLNKQFSQKILDHIVPKKELFIVLPYVGMPSLCLRTCLQKSINSNILFCNTKSIFKSSTQLAHFFFSKIGYLCVYALTMLIGLCVVDAMLPILAKHVVILKLTLGNTQVFSTLTNKRSK